MEIAFDTVHIATQRRIKLEYTNPGGEVDYPSQWFEREGNMKPTVNVPEHQGSAEALIRAVKGGIRAATLTLKTAKQFIFHYGKKMEDNPPEQWASFNRDIGNYPDKVTPWDIVDIHMDHPSAPSERMIEPPAPDRTGSPEDPNNWTERAVMLYILCLYRLLRIRNDDYSDLLQKRMEDQITAEGGKGMSFHGARGIYSSWINDRGFLRMVAAIDMFLYKFKSHPDGILRLGSLSSRFRDCAGLMSLGYAMSILNIEAGDLIDWVFIKKMGDEIIQITKTGQESGKLDSYFPYQSDFGLITKSAYSSNANPYIYTWVHVFGSLLGHKRSLNARFIFEGSYSDIGLNAVLIAWVYARGGELNPQFSKEGTDYGANLVAGSDEGEEGDADQLDDENLAWVSTLGRDPKAWFAILKGGGFKIPAVVSRVIRRQRDKIREVRDDTVGEFVKNRLIF